MRDGLCAILATTEGQTEVIICESAADREAKTISAIWIGEPPADEAEEILRELRAEGEISFEEGSVRWIDHATLPSKGCRYWRITLERQEDSGERGYLGHCGDCGKPAEFLHVDSTVADHQREPVTVALRELRSKLEAIVVTKGEDKGVVLLSNDAPTRIEDGVEVYELEHFSPLGEALIALHDRMRTALMESLGVTEEDIRETVPEE